MSNLSSSFMPGSCCVTSKSDKLPYNYSLFATTSGERHKNQNLPVIEYFKDLLMASHLWNIILCLVFIKHNKHRHCNVINISFSSYTFPFDSFRWLYNQFSIDVFSFLVVDSLLNTHLSHLRCICVLSPSKSLIMF